MAKEQKSDKLSSSPQNNPESDEDYYVENGFLVFTPRFLSKRGYCCGNGCRHCPYTPKHGGAHARLPEC